MPCLVELPKTQPEIFAEHLEKHSLIGFGGYSAFPVCLAARLKGIPTVIHEQNAVLGRANAYLAPKATRIALSLPEMSSLDELDSMRAVVTGNPVRAFQQYAVLRYGRRKSPANGELSERRPP